MSDRGSEAYFQAYGYVTAGNPGKSARWRRWAASRYLAVTASPPLTQQEEKAARSARRSLRRARG